MHPEDRITVQEGLEHPYLKDFHGQMPEPCSKSLFDFDFERGEDELSYREVQELMYDEVVKYRPEADSKADDVGSYLDSKRGGDSRDEQMLSADEGKNEGDSDDDDEAFVSMDAS